MTSGFFSSLLKKICKKFDSTASCQVTHDLTVDASTLHHFISDPVKVLTKSEVKMALCSFAERLNLSHFVFRFFFYWDTQLKSNFRTLWHHACVPSKRKGLQVYIKITNYGQVETWVMSSYLWLQYLQLHDFAQLPYRHPDWKRFKSILILVLEYGSSKMEGIWCYKMKKVIQLTKNRYSYLS